jgi:uncharacterized protein (TIGR00730 family)
MPRKSAESQPSPSSGRSQERGPGGEAMTDKVRPQSETGKVPLLQSARDVEQAFLSGKRDRGRDLESAVRIFLEFLQGFEFFDVAMPCVTVFGSARFHEGHRYYAMAQELGQRLAQAGYTVMTGGGPGVMEAANRGAKEAGGLSIGANIMLSHEQDANSYMDRFMEFDHFFVRKVMLVKYSCAFVVMPGGFGTLDEVFETITLMQTDKIRDFPVILMGTEYWGPLIDFLQKTLVTEATVGRADLNLVRVTDSVDEALEWITASICVKTDEKETDRQTP